MAKSNFKLLAGEIVFETVDGVVVTSKRTGYAIANVNGIPTITCLECGRASTNLHDIAQKYCGWCKKFHLDEALRALLED